MAILETLDLTSTCYRHTQRPRKSSCSYLLKFYSEPFSNILLCLKRILTHSSLLSLKCDTAGRTWSWHQLVFSRNGHWRSLYLLVRPLDRTRELLLAYSALCYPHGMRGMRVLVACSLVTNAHAFSQSTTSSDVDQEVTTIPAQITFHSSIAWSPFSGSCDTYVLCSAFRRTVHKLQHMSS